MKYGGGDVQGLVEYARERLFLAYMLTKQEAEATTILDAWRAHDTLPEHSIAAAMVAIPEDEMGLYTACAAAYDNMVGIYSRCAP